MSLIIIDALEVDDVGRHLSNLSRGASCHRQLLRGAVNPVASAEVVVFVGDDAAVTAAAIATATAQVEPLTSSSLPNLWKLSDWRSNGAVSTAGATVGRSDVRCRRRRLTSALLHLAVVAICATIELFELGDARPLGGVPYVHV